MVQWCRGTFQGQAYGPFSDIPAVWDATFGSKSYSALAAGIAGKRTAPLCPPCILTNASSLPLKPDAAAPPCCLLRAAELSRGLQLFHDLDLRCMLGWITFMRCRQRVSDSLMHAGDGIEQLRWRLDAGELPPEVPPKVIVLAVGSNARGMVRTPRILSLQAG